jgi:hypothetical protein
MGGNVGLGGASARGLLVADAMNGVLLSLVVSCWWHVRKVGFFGHGFVGRSWGRSRRV